MRKLVSGVAAAALLASASLAYAADAQPASNGQLAPGNAAGVHNAQLFDSPTAWWVGGTLLVAGVGAAILLSQGDHTNSSVNTTK